MRMEPFTTTEQPVQPASESNTALTKHVSVWKLYAKTFGFVAKRIKYYIFAMLFFIAYWLLYGALTLYVPQVMSKIGWLIQLVNTFALAFLISFIAGWNKRSYLLGQIGIITNEAMTGTVPEKSFKTGLQMAQDRFQGVGVWKLTKDSIRFLFRTVFRRGREKREVKEQFLLLVQELVSLLVLIFAGVFGQLGACLITYAYRYPQSKVNIRCILKAGRHYFKHIGGVIVKRLLGLAIWLGASCVLALPAALGLRRLLEGSFLDEAVCELLPDMFPALDRAMAGSIVFGIFFILLAVLVALLITDPFDKIRMVRYYLRCLERDGTDADEHLDAGVLRLRRKLSKKIHRRKRDEAETDVPGCEAKEDGPAETSSLNG